MIIHGNFDHRKYFSSADEKIDEYTMNLDKDR